MPEIHAWLTRDGYWDGEVDSPSSSVDWDTFVKDCAAHGHVPIEKSASDLGLAGEKDVPSTRPPNRPLTPEQLAFRAKRDEYDALRAKGWDSLTDVEKARAQTLRFDLGL